MSGFIKGELPLQPPPGEQVGLDDDVWKMIQECWNLKPEARPTMKDVRRFLEPLHQSWIPPTPDYGYVDFTRYSDGTVPSRPGTASDVSVGDILLESGGSPGSRVFPEPGLVSTRTEEWVLAQQSAPSLKTSRPGVTFEENPVVFNLPPLDYSAFAEPWTHLL